MKTLANLSAKDVAMALKRRLTLSDLCVQYRCTESELDDRLHQLFKYYGADQRLEELRANDKRAQRAVDRSLKRMLDRCQAAVDALTEIPAPTDPSPAAVLNTLHERETQLSTSIINLETEHKRLARSHRDCMRQLRDLQHDLEQIKATLESKVADYDRIVAENNDLVAQMNELSTARRQQLNELTTVRAEIERRSVISVYFYEDGIIETDDTSQSQLNEAGADLLYDQLLDSDLCQNLRMRDIRLLARAIAIARNSDRQIDPAFESAELDACFSKLVDPAVLSAKCYPPPANELVFRLTT